MPGVRRGQALLHFSARDPGSSSMGYAFLVETYETERLKVMSAWAAFQDQDLPFRPHPSDRRGLGIEGAPTLDAYADEAALLQGEAASGAKAVLPGPGARPPTERPGV